MSLTLNIHAAGEAEKIEAFCNVHDVWGGGLSIEEHLERRLNSVQHQRAKWYVGTLDGRVVTSLGCYPVQFRLDGEIVPGIAIGAVHTLAEHRGRGFAPQLMDSVEQEQRSNGAVLSLLYSDINPGYYARLGYIECPSLEGWLDPRRFAPREEAYVAEVARLWPNSGEFGYDPASARGQIAALYEDAHAVFPISIHRDADYWDYVLAKAGDDTYLWLKENPSGENVGYVHVGRVAGSLKLCDVSFPDQTAASWRRLLAGVCRFAVEEGASRIGGWLPAGTGVEGLIPLTKRRTEITMLKPLDPAVGLDQATIDSAKHFREIDHV